MAVPNEGAAVSQRDAGRSDPETERLAGKLNSESTNSFDTFNSTTGFDFGESFVSWGLFTMGDGGLTVLENRKDKSSQELICGPFEILGATRDPNGKEWGKWLRWRDGDGVIHTRHVGDGALQGDPAALCSSLASEGLRVNRAKQRALAEYLAGVVVSGRVTMVGRSGWHNIDRREVFVLPNESIGGGFSSVILDGAAIGPYEQRGSLADWQAGVGALASDHALAVFAISAALAGPLLYLAGQEGGGINFYGPSSKGKTTILQMAASVWGRGSSPGYVRAWRATANGLEGAASSASDTALILDELGVVEARDAASAVYGLANGSAKVRAARDGSLREPKTFRVLVLSSGEMPLGVKLSEERGRKVRAGQLVRLLDISVDRGLGCGAFDCAGPDHDAAKLSQGMKQAAVTSYGTAGPEFVRSLLVQCVDGDTVRAMVSDFVATTVPPGADGQVGRAAQRLGLIAAAGELATFLGIVPWREGAAREAATWALGQWIDGRGGADPHEARQAIQQVRLAIEQHGESRFELIGGDGDARPVINRLGWRKGEGSKREWWVPPEVWKSEICAGLDPIFVAKVLSERGLLRMPSGRGFQVKVNLGGDYRQNAYALTAPILGGGDDDA